MEKKNKVINLTEDRLKKLLNKIKINNKKIVGPDPGPFKLDIFFKDTGKIEREVECFGSIHASKFNDMQKNASFRDAINDRYFTRYNVQDEKHDKLRLTINDKTRKEPILIIVEKQTKKDPQPGDKNNNYKITDYSLFKDLTLETLLDEEEESNELTCKKILPRSALLKI